MSVLGSPDLFSLLFDRSFVGNKPINELLWQAIRTDNRKRPLKGFHVRDQVFLFLRGQVELLDLIAQVRIRMTTLIVPFDHFFQRLLAPIVHVGTRLRNVPYGWCFEGTLVLLNLGLIVTAKVGIRFVHADPDVVILFIGEVGTGVARRAVGLAEE